MHHHQDTDLNGNFRRCDESERRASKLGTLFSSPLSQPPQPSIFRSCHCCHPSLIEPSTLICFSSFGSMVWASIMFLEPIGWFVILRTLSAKVSILKAEDPNVTHMQVMVTCDFGIFVGSFCCEEDGKCRDGTD